MDIACPRVGKRHYLGTYGTVGILIRYHGTMVPWYLGVGARWTAHEKSKEHQTRITQCHGSTDGVFRSF